MKRLMASVFAAALLLSLAACGTDADTPATDTDPPAVEATDNETQDATPTDNDTPVSPILEAIDQALQGTWVSPDGGLTFTFDHGTMTYDTVRMSDGGPNDTGTVSYRVTETAVVWRYAGVDRDTELQLSYDNDVLTLYGQHSANDGGGQYEFIKQ